MMLPKYSNEITYQTIKYLVEDNFTVPLLIDIDRIQNTINNFFGIEEVEQEKRVLAYKRAVKLTNSILANQMINACDLFQKFIAVSPKMSWSDLQESILSIVFRDVEELILSGEIPPLMSDNGIFINKCIQFITTLIGAMRECLESVVSLLGHNEFDCQLFDPLLESLVENELGKVCLNFKEFSFVYQADFIILFEKMKETVHCLVQDVQLFLFKMSLFANQQMALLDKLFHDNPALINVRTFQTIQVEVANYIVTQIESYFLMEASLFWRPEFHQHRENFVKSSLVNFYAYSQEPLRLIGLPKKTCDFQSCFQRLGMEFQHQVAWVQIMFTQDRIQQHWEQTQITKSQSAKYRPNQHLGIIIQDQYFMTLYEGIWFVFAVQSMDLFELEEQTLTKFESMTLKQFINSKIFVVVEEGVQQIDEIEQCGNLRKLSMNCQIHRSNVLFEVTQLTFVDGKPVDQVDKMYPFRKLDKPAEKLAQGPSGSSAPADTSLVAGGMLGAGIGMLLVDSLDKKMPWSQKLQRCGMSTLEGSAYGLIAIQMPVIGMLIAQTYLFLNLHAVINNKVLNTTLKLKKLGHFGVQSGLGIGSAIIGQLLIPIPFLGAVIGGTIGGISASLYGKFVVPNTRSSILRMLLRVHKNQSELGEIVFTEDIIENMRIRAKHLYGNKPESMPLNHWLTLALVNLVNEVHYLFTLKMDEEFKDLHEKLKSTEDDEEREEVRQRLVEKEIELEQVERMSIEYEASRMFLDFNHISILENASDVNRFVQGMISNFRI